MNWNKAIRLLDDVLCIISVIIMPLKIAEFICEPYIERRCEDDRQDKREVAEEN